MTDNSIMKTIKHMPKVLLHDHTDGGLRTETMIEIAAEIGYELPADTPEALQAWVDEKANSGSLPEYLEVFAHTTAVMQRAEDIERVHYEAALDVADDNVIYYEGRFAPEQHLTTGLTLHQVVNAALTGFAHATTEIRGRGQEFTANLIIDAMRMNSPENSLEIAELTTAFKGYGVVGFDIAGPEDGFPPQDHLPAFTRIHDANMWVTIHAGEVNASPTIDPLDSMAKAMHPCGCHRIGHGVQVATDITFSPGDNRVLGDFAAFVRDVGMHLELAPTSNVQTGAAASIADHPLRMLYQEDFHVGLNTDNRLLSVRSITDEFAKLHAAWGWGRKELAHLMFNAATRAFIPLPAKQLLLRALRDHGDDDDCGNCC